MRRAPLTRTLAAAAAGALLLAGCTADEPDPSTSPTASPPAETPQADPVPPSSETPLAEDDPVEDVPFGEEQDPSTSPPSDETTAPSDRPGLSPTGMRFGVHETFDRVVIDLAGEGEPGWSTEYTGTATAAGSGEAVQVAGQSVLEVTIEGVALPTEEGAAVWEGPESIAPASAGVIEQVARGPLLEGRQQVFVGVGSEEAFRVFALQEPARLVVDVYHPPVAGGDEPLPDEDPAGDDAPFPANREPDTSEMSDDARLSPVDLRFGVHDGFDRLVLDLSGPGQPGWLGEYTDDPRLAGSGAPVELAGEASLQTHVRGVVYPTEEGAEEYAGPQRFRPGSAGVVQEVVYGAIYEGQLELYVGLTSEEPFRVFQLEDPTRLVIDVYHPGEAPAEEAPDGDAAPFPADRQPDTSEVSAGARLSPVDLRFAAREGFDRVVVDLAGEGTPGWRGEYVDNPTQQAAGEPVYLQGQHFLRILVRGVVYPTAEGARPYEGPRTMTPSTGGVIAEVRYGAMFEAQAEIWIGLSSDEPFRVFGLEDPTRVVIDVQHP
ncbi:AMIN domain-containing protein [Actinotalea sp. BY-33]|uniref:AMIN domain-containing protein n=1 Tax=Actinotalea soli TaxID=2819234 RepID=A0A939LP87_9CELL|nr:AMIN domain-containing protein [Actinotalea soli]MBO1751711.1 AMIN domain-containing protein [Actinotalea soli]